MDAPRYSRGGWTGRALSTSAVLGAVMGLDVVTSSAASASNRLALGTATTSNGNAAVLLALGGAVLVLGGIGFVFFTWTRRKRQPVQCAAQREALELAEKAVRYWEAARTHLESVERQRTLTTGATADESSHALLVAKAVEGHRTAMQQRDDRQMELIRCMASGTPGALTTHAAQSQPFFTPSPDGAPPTSAPNAG
jgi:hypothetical protein